MDNLQLRQRIVRGMIRVSERTANMRKPEKFEYRKHMGHETGRAALSGRYGSITGGSSDLSGAP